MRRGRPGSRSGFWPCCWPFLVVATWFLPRHTTGAGMVWRVRLPFVPSDMHKEFATASVAMMTTYTQGVLILSLGGQVAHDLIGSPNALANGAVLSLFAIVSGAVRIVARPITARTAMTLGALASATGMGLFALAAALHGLHAFLLATAISGAGYSLLFLSAADDHVLLKSTTHKLSPFDRQTSSIDGGLPCPNDSSSVVQLSHVMRRRHLLRSEPDIAVVRIERSFPFDEAAPVS
jgi:hypothetical protein